MKMIDVGWKFENLRTAKAVGRIRLSPETVKKIKEGKIARKLLAIMAYSRHSSEEVSKIFQRRDKKLNRRNH